MNQNKTSGRARRSAEPATTDLQADTTAVQPLLLAGGDLALVLDGAGHVLEAHARDANLERAMRQGWQGRDWQSTVTVESHDKLTELMSQALAGTTSTPRQVNHPFNGNADLPVLYTTVLLSGNARHPESIRIAALGRDLRDTMALQRRLVDAQQTMERDYWRFREAETRYRNLFQHSGEAVLIVDGSTLRIGEFNPSAQALFGDGSDGKPLRMAGVALASLFEEAAAEPLAAALAAARSVGKREVLIAAVAGGTRQLQLSISSFRQDQAAYLLVRLSAREGERAAANAYSADAEPPVLGERFLQTAGDAVVFTDPAGRVQQVNPAFVRLAQLSSADQARGELLDRWLGRTGVELPVLVANLREHGSTGLFATQLRGALGMVVEVEVAASTLPPGPGAAVFGFALRDIGRRLAPSEHDLPTKVPATVQQLTELVGRVPLKQIVAETSDLIERLSIETALQMTHDNRAMAAQLLGLSRQSLYVKLRRFGMGGLDADDS